MKQKLILLSTVIILIVLCNGCTMRSDFTAISDKNVNISNLKIDKKKILGHVTGEDCQPFLLGIPLSGPPLLKEALDKALKQNNANLLLDAVVKDSSFSIILFGQHCWTAEGYAYDTYQ